MLSLTLHWWKCPVEIVDYGLKQPRAKGKTIYDIPKYGRYFRLKLDRRKNYRFDKIDLMEPVVTHFLNASSEDAMVGFLERFGPLSGEIGDEMPAEYVAGQQVALSALLEKAVSGEPKLPRPTVERLLQNIRLKPSLNYSGKSPRLALQSQTLRGFMVMEIVLAAAAGAGLGRCLHCGEIFLTGPMTGRRSSAKFCLDRHRAAYARNRKKEGDIKNVDTET